MCNQKGQTIMPQYTLAVFLAIAAIMAISLFVQRALQARYRDTKNYMVEMASSGCVQADASGGSEGALHCGAAAGMGDGKSLKYEYEPYYGLVSSNVDRAYEDSKELSGGGIGSTGIFKKTFKEQTAVETRSEQAPPSAAKDAK